MNYKRFFLPSKPARIVVWRREPMTDEEIAAALGGWAETEPTRRAVEQIVQQMVDECSQDLGGGARDADDLKRLNGAATALQNLQAKLAELTP